ncbi:LysR family transcriptional regulator [Nitrospirillum viridazoti]|uniref:LysR family transcriptional regulator n=1 Tax=Nitrospirillum amazonense TaxID=28077 RepID=A0A560HUB1_9PROT|nr:LysR family transcriptional regulator [Nitrospirillum amazonense]TWB49945.1 LysR family transcriptional regulator [Nitrospirillum amazonense]
MDISQIDLNLLHVFDALYRERQVTRAGRALGLSQSAVSNALARLRQHMGDDLFVRTPTGMVPTAVADTMARPLQGALDQVRAALAARQPFLPCEARDAITVGLSDHAEFVLGPPLVAALRAEAPGLSLVLRHADKDNALPGLESGLLDLALGMLPDPPAHMTRQMLVRDSLAVLMRPGHPALDAPWTLETYLAYSHLLVSATASKVGAVDRMLETVGRQRTLAVVASHLLAAAPMLRDSDLVCTMPARVAHPLADSFGLAVLPLPADMPVGDKPAGGMRLSMVWHRRLDSHPAHAWLRRRVAEVARSLPPVPGVAGGGGDTAAA